MHVTSHHDTAFKSGQMVKFEGTSADNLVSGGMPVRVINPHSNKHLVSKVEGKGKKMRAYAGGHSHMPQATVERPEYTRKSDGVVVPAKQFEAHHHTLHSLSQHSEDEGVEQFGDNVVNPPSYQQVLRKHGYKKDPGTKGTYTHPEHGTGVELDGPNWHHHYHSEDGGQTIAKGKTLGSFHRHMEGFHGSQHSEEPETPDYEALVAAGPVGTQRW